jgi:RNA polymerase sigma factor for flagellar operon FliA
MVAGCIFIFYYHLIEMRYRHKNAAPSPRTAGNGSYANGNGDAMEALAIEHLPLIRYTAIRIAERTPPNVSIDDLISAGGEALTKIADRFDETRGVKFWTYGGWRVEGAMLDHLRGLDPLGRLTRKNVKDVEAAYDSLTQRLGRQPSHDEVTKELSWTIEKLHHVQLCQMLGNYITFPDMVDCEEGKENLYNPWKSTIEEKSPFDLAYEREVHDMLQTGLARLPPRDREVLDLYYAKGITMKEIGRQIGVNESRVSQLHAKAILRLRKNLKLDANGHIYFER